MLENIKLILGLEDSSKDNVINYYINKLTQKVLNYCHLKELPNELEGFVEEKVINIVSAVVKNQNITKEQKVKSIQRGDTRIEFLLEDEKSINSFFIFNNDDIRELKAFRKVAW